MVVEKKPTKPNLFGIFQSRFTLNHKSGISTIAPAAIKPGQTDTGTEEALRTTTHITTGSLSATMKDLLLANRKWMPLL